MRHASTKSHQWRVDPAAATHLAYLAQQLLPLVAFKLDHATLVRRALLAYVEQIDTMRQIECPETREMRQLLEGVRLREAANVRDSLVTDGDLEANPERLFKQHHKAALERLKQSNPFARHTPPTKDTTNAPQETR
jgi:hypothetical protein